MPVVLSAIEKKRPDLIKRLIAVGFKPAPYAARIGDDDRQDGFVTASSPDGVYFRFEDLSVGDLIQIMVVGPMLETPKSMAQKIHRGYWVKSVDAMIPVGVTPEVGQIVIERGFFSIILIHQDQANRPSGLKGE